MLRRVGPRIGLRTVRDLLLWLPRRYDDLRILHDLQSLRFVAPDTIVSARATVLRVRAGRTARRGVRVVTADLADGTGVAEAQWYGRQYVERRIHEGDDLLFSGKLKKRGATVLLDNPAFQPPDGDLVHVGRIVPVYRLTAGLPIRTLRGAIRAALDRLPPYDEYLGAPIRDELGLVGIGEALSQVHFPDSFEHRDAALRRLAFDELLALQVGMVARDRQRRLAVGDPIATAPARDAEIRREIEAALERRLEREVTLTVDQDHAMDVIRDDVRGPHPMLRLLQGDVGSGKTAVAALALAFVADAGRQGALLAPTDLLARQHAVALRRLLEPLGHGVTLLTGTLPATERRAAMEQLAAPTAGDGLLGLTAGRVVVGTHALVQESVQFADLALAVVDEQHRFGVAQREALGAKGISPHMLLMTATPIPRTLGQILLADLDVSDLRSLPAGRLKVKTGIRRSADLTGAADDPGRGAYPLIVREVRAGHRAFVVVPLIEEDEEMTARSADEVARAMPAELAEAAARIGLPAEPAARVGVVHGQMRAADRDGRMDLFRRGELDVLVGTTVLEVGVDVPEATVMLILDADRFGLAQLHQLRGRVGRGEAQSYCILVSDSTDATARARLEALESNNDGFELAEMDLELRREGELLGFHQSGLPTLRIASLRDRGDRRRAAQARAVAESLVDETGALRPGNEALAVELRAGWLARVGAGEVLADVPDEAPGAFGE